MSLDAFLDMAYRSLFWLAIVIFIAILAYIIYSSLEKG